MIEHNKKMHHMAYSSVLFEIGHGITDHLTALLTDGFTKTNDNPMSEFVLALTPELVQQAYGKPMDDFVEVEYTYIWDDITS